MTEDNKQILEQGFNAMIDATWAGAPELQRKELRMAFFGGANHLLKSIMALLSPDAEPTDQDLNMLQSVQAELDQFISAFELEYFDVAGRA